MSLFAAVIVRFTDLLGGSCHIFRTLSSKDWYKFPNILRRRHRCRHGSYILFSCRGMHISSNVQYVGWGWGGLQMMLSDDRAPAFAVWSAHGSPRLSHPPLPVSVFSLFV